MEFLLWCPVMKFCCRRPTMYWWKTTQHPGGVRASSLIILVAAAVFDLDLGPDWNSSSSHGNIHRPPVSAAVLWWHESVLNPPLGQQHSGSITWHPYNTPTRGGDPPYLTMVAAAYTYPVYDSGSTSSMDMPDVACGTREWPNTIQMFRW